MFSRKLPILATVVVAAVPAIAAAQTFEVVGTRALGMGGAFVGVADDASAPYWNPAGLATGATASVLFDGVTFDVVPERDAPLDLADRARSVTGRAFSLTTLAFGLSYVRLHTTDLSPDLPAGSSAAGREEEGIDSPGAVSLRTHQFGLTMVQALLEGVTVGTTLKIVRGTVASATEVGGATPVEALDQADDLEGQSTTRFDLDLGLMFAAGSAKLGVVARNVREAEFDNDVEGDPIELRRQLRLGLAVTPGHPAAVPGAPTTIAVDVDLRRAFGVLGDVRNLAVGVEQWMAGRRIGLRGGFRVNTLRRDERVGSAGVSVALRPRSFVEAQITRGPDELERSWGVATRLMF